MFWTTIITLIVSCTLWKIFFENARHPLDYLPGPPRKPIIGNVLEFLNASPRSMFIKLRMFAKMYGDRYLIKIINRRILHTTSEKDVEIILSHSKNITKNKPYTFLHAWLGTGLLLSTGTKWHTRRKILTPTFHFNILKKFALVMNEKSRELVARLKTTNGDKVDLISVISDFTLYTLCETAMGTQLDSDKTEAKLEYKKAITEISSLLLGRLTKVWLHNEFIFRMFPIGKQFEKCLHKVRVFANDVIKERRKTRVGTTYNPSSSEDDLGTKKRTAMLDLLLDAEENGEISFEGIQEEVNTFMFEGHDTTAMALTFCLMLISEHQKVQDLIFEELRHIFSVSDRSPSMTDLSKMKYLEAVIKESLRLYPSVPFIGREITEDFMLGDLCVPKGTEVAVHIYDLHRREELFPDAAAFKPERFLGEERHPYAFVPFSAGPRNCIGQKFAMMEMKCLLSEIIRNFGLKPHANGVAPALVADMLLRPNEPIYIHFITRSQI